jgi:hypothetical protein
MPIREAYWIDTKNGYTWVRRESTIPALPNFKQVEETSWQVVAGAYYVPTALHADDNQLPGKLRQTADWKIVWESVNDRVDPKYFQPQDFAPGQRLPVYDYSSGQPVFLGDNDVLPVREFLEK